MTLTRTRADQLIAAFAGKRILVLGDVMLDQFIWGKVRRISPEAPVPVVEVANETYHLGGAGNVAANIRALGGIPVPIGMIGEDFAADRLTELLKTSGIEASGLHAATGRPTTVKMRIVAHSQQIVRADRESKAPLSPENNAALAAAFAKWLPSTGAVVVSDYDKGVVNRTLLSEVLPAAQRARIPALLDPKVHHADYYKPITLITPNHREAELLTGMTIENDYQLEEAGRKLLEKFECPYALITRGEEGMSLFFPGGSHHLPTFAREVFDVTGAGDTVIATLALAQAGGATMEESATLANHAAGLAVGKVGTATVSPADSSRISTPVMRILQVSSPIQLGGGETHVLELTEGLRRLGHEVLVAGRRGGAVKPDIEFAFRNAIDLGTVFRLRRLLKREKFDIIHAHVARDYPLVAVAAGGAPGKLVYTRHLLYPIKAPFLYDRVDGWIAPTRQILETLAPLKPRVSAVIPNWVDLEKFPFRPHASHHPLTLGLLGQISPHKGHEDAIEALRILGSGFRLIIGGRGTEKYERTLKEKAAGLPVHFAGFVSLPSFFETVDVLLVPSWEEPFGIVLLEAMASGIPVIASASGGPVEIIRAGEGILVPPRDPKSLANAIRTIEPLREEITREARSRVETFDIQNAIPKIDAFYRTL